MGTGSHRPQIEAAKGRADEVGGIKHERALKSHAKLKFRAVSSTSLQAIKETEFIHESKPREKSESRDGGEIISENDQDSDLEEMHSELALLKQKESLRAAKAKTRSEWRSEGVFKRKSNPRVAHSIDKNNS